MSFETTLFKSSLKNLIFNKLPSLIDGSLHFVFVRGIASI
ncbi:hypothetical protein SAMN05216315_1471, partial [Nitrosospira sp. Nsp18]